MNLMDMIFGKRNDPISLAIDEALSLLDRGEHDAAIAVLRDKALSREPEHRRALLHLGVCHMVKGDWDRAESILEPLAVKGFMAMDSESAAAGLALDKIAADRAKANRQ